MVTLRGTASHCQNTSRVSGGGNNGAVSTTYVALCRLDRQQVQFSTRAPLSISDGDKVVVAGRMWIGALYADAVRNVTTGLMKHSGIVSRAFVALLLLAIGVIFTLVATGILGTNSRWVYLGFIAGAIYLLYRAVQTGSALHAVNSSTP